MSNSRNISFGSGGTYNESVQIHGDFVQGDKIQGDKIQGDKIVNHDFSKEIIYIQSLLEQFSKQYPLDEAVNKTAHELAVSSRKSLERKNKLVALAQYISTNGGIEASIGKAIEIALKLVLGV